MKWALQEKPADDTILKVSRFMETEVAFPVPLAQILCQRGICELSEAIKFFRPNQDEIHSPFLMADMEKAVSLLRSFTEADKPVLIYGDYDVDGTTAIAAMVSFFKTYGYRYEYYIPDRYQEGYGLSFQGIDYADNHNIKLIVTLDCGIKAIEKVKYAKSKEIKVIICDHHTPGNRLPEAEAILNPKRVDCAYPFKELSGCGVGVKLLDALQQRLKQEGLIPASDPNVYEMVGDLLAVSIGCDIVPVTGENRILAHYGLKKFRENPSPGLDELKNQSTNTREWNISDLVFFIGPRINAAGRLESARHAVEILLNERKSANELELLNEARKQLDEKITTEALERISQDPASGEKITTVLNDESWHKGIIGIVASRVIEKHYKPTILLTKSQEVWVGSGRSVEGFDLYEALEACSEHILQFGGHKHAAGLTVRDEELEPLAQKLEAFAQKKLNGIPPEPVLAVDCELDFSYLDDRFIRLLRYFEPFGPGNAEPVFATRKVRVLNHRILKEKHVRFQLEQSGCTFEAIGFNLAEKWTALQTAVMDVAYHAGFKTWMGTTSIQLRLKDIKAASSDE